MARSGSGAPTTATDTFLWINCCNTRLHDAAHCCLTFSRHRSSVGRLKCPVALVLLKHNKRFIHFKSTAAAVNSIDKHHVRPHRGRKRSILEGWLKIHVLSGHQTFCKICARGRGERTIRITSHIQGWFGVGFLRTRMVLSPLTWISW